MSNSTQRDKITLAAVIYMQLLAIQVPDVSKRNRRFETPMNREQIRILPSSQPHVMTPLPFLRARQSRLIFRTAPSKIARNYRDLLLPIQR